LESELQSVRLDRSHYGLTLLWFEVSKHGLSREESGGVGAEAHHVSIYLY